MASSKLKTNLDSVRQSITEFELRYGRKKNDVRLIAVSKTRNCDEILELVEGGQIHFGENYLQEAVDKIANITDKELIWHFIGPIQNKMEHCN